MDQSPTRQAVEAVDHYTYRDAGEVVDLHTQDLRIQEAVVEAVDQHMSQGIVLEEVGSSQTKLLTGRARLETVFPTAAADAQTVVGRPSLDEEEPATAVAEDQVCVEGSYKDTAGCMGSSWEEHAINGSEECASS